MGTFIIFEMLSAFSFVSGWDGTKPVKSVLEAGGVLYIASSRCDKLSLLFVFLLYILISPFLSFTLLYAKKWGLFVVNKWRDL